MAKQFFRQKITVAKLPAVIRYKWGEEALKEGVTGVPKKLVRNLGRIFPGDGGVEQLQVALTLVDYRRENEKRFPTAAFLAFLSGLREEVFWIRLNELKVRGLVDYTPVRRAVMFDVSGLLKAIEKHSTWQPLGEPWAAEDAVENENEGPRPF